MRRTRRGGEKEKNQRGSEWGGKERSLPLRGRPRVI